jgi:hypothetical protein
LTNLCIASSDKNNVYNDRLTENNLSLLFFIEKKRKTEKIVILDKVCAAGVRHSIAFCL